MRRLAYRFLSTCMVRTPLLPINMLAQVPSVQGPKDVLAKSPWIEPAIASASPSTYAAMQRPRADQHLTRTLQRYLTRMASRPTPFGLFAAVAFVDLGEETTLRLVRIPDRTYSHPDMGWLFEHVKALECRPDVLPNLCLWANPLAIRRGHRLFLDPPAFPHGPEAAPSVSVVASRAVLIAMETAKTPVPFASLAETLAKLTPEATSTQIEAFVATLVERSFLLTDLRPPLAVEAPASHVASRLARVPAAREAHERLLAILNAARRFDSCTPAQRVTVCQDIAMMCDPNTPAVRPALHVEAAAATNGGTLNRRVAADAALCAELLLQLSPWRAGGPWLVAYRTAFEARYGVGYEVPLAECVDPELGLGPIDGFGPAAPPARSAAADDMLVSLATASVMRHGREVLLDDATLAVLIEPNQRIPLPPSVDILVAVAACSAEAIDDGNYLVVVAPAIGAVPGGRVSGRFIDLLGTPRRGAPDDLSEPAVLSVGLSYAPRLPSQANVVVRPPWCAHEVAIDVPSAANVPIPIDEIVIGATARSLYARWIHDPRPLSIAPGHMLTYRAAPPAARLLCEIATGAHAQLTAFQWNGLERLPFLPRLRFGRCVLSPAIWRLTAPAWQRYRQEYGSAASAVAAWRREFDVPRMVMLGEADQHLCVDLDDPGSTAEIDKAIRTSAALRLRELLPAADEMWLAGPGGRYAAEFAVTLVRTGEASASLPPRGRVRTAGVDLRHVGSDWLYLKLYLLPSLMEDVLICDVTRVVADSLTADEAASWFFVRYADPDPHLRLRFRGEPDTLMGALLPRLCAWAHALVQEGKATRFTFDSYDRELQRYGGALALQVVEEIFRLDSDFTLRLLGCRGNDDLPDPRALAALSAYTLLDSLADGYEVRSEVLQGWKAHRNASTLAHRSCRHDLQALGIAYHRFDCNVAPIPAMLSERSRLIRLLAMRLAEFEKFNVFLPDVLRSILHMHCNRLLGIERTREEEALGLAWRLAIFLERQPANVHVA